MPTTSLSQWRQRPGDEHHMDKAFAVTLGGRLHLMVQLWKIGITFFTGKRTRKECIPLRCRMCAPRMLSKLYKSEKRQRCPINHTELKSVRYAQVGILWKLHAEPWGGRKNTKNASPPARQSILPIPVKKVCSNLGEEPRATSRIFAWSSVAKPKNQLGDTMTTTTPLLSIVK